MRNFTGCYKKTIAGIGCAISICFVSHLSFANAPVADNHAMETQVTAPSTSSGSEVTPNLTAVSTNVAKPIAVPPAKANSASQLASLVGGLALILALIYGLSWFVKRFSQGGFLQNPTMKIVSAMPLGTRERLMLVDVAGKQLLLGVTATQINTLHVFDEPVVPTEKSPPVASDFSQKLMAILQQKNVGSSGFSASGEDANKKSNS